MKRFKLNGILAVALVSVIVGFSFVACGNGGGGPRAVHHTVTFMNGDDVWHSQQVVAGQQVNWGEFYNPTYEDHAYDYNFVAWSSSDTALARFHPNTAINTNVTLYADWFDGDVWAVTFNFNTGANATGVNAVVAHNVPDGGYVWFPGGAASNPTRLPGYLFAGWFDAEDTGNPILATTPINADTVVWARWDAARILSFELFGLGVIAAVTVPDGAYVYDHLPYPAPSHADAYFFGWFANHNDTGTNYYDNSVFTGMIAADTQTVDADMTIYARWDVTVTFDFYGGSYESDDYEEVVIVRNNAVAMARVPAPVNEGYEFSGWRNAAGALVNPLTTLFMAHTTLYAVWEGQEHSATFNFMNLGGPYGPLNNVAHGTLLYNLLPEAPYHDDADFAGWFTNHIPGPPINFTGQVTSTSPYVTADVTVFVRWDVDVTFDLAGGEYNDSEYYVVRTIIRNNSVLLANVPDPTKYGYTFSHWAISPYYEYEDRVNPTSYAFAAHTTLVAQWNEEYDGGENGYENGED